MKPKRIASSARKTAATTSHRGQAEKRKTDLRTVPVSRMRQVGTLVDLLAGMPMKDPRYAIFLGAGASVSSGVPAAAQLTTRWQRRIFLNRDRRLTWQTSYEEDFESWKEKDYKTWKVDWQAANGRQPNDYALLFSYTFPDVDGRQGFIERICAGCEPGPGYIYLSSLTLAGYFHTFLTTNFDDLIHDALFRYGGLKPVVCAFDSEVSSIRPQSPRPKIIKLHGDFLFNNLRNVGSEVSHLDRNMEEKFERTCESYGLIVIGYGGQDQSVMAPLLSMLHKRDCLKHGIHWCIYTDRARQNTDFREVPEEIYRMWNQYSNKVHLYDTGTFDEVMEALYFGCHCPPPPDLANPEERALYTRLRDGIENADQTWRLTPRFSNLLGTFRKARLQPPPKVLDLLDTADQEHRNGDEKLKGKDFAGARQQFEAAIANAEEALIQAENQAQRVRGYRRLSGSKTSICEVCFKQQGYQKDSGQVSPADSEEISSLAKAARDDVRKGLEIDSEISSPPDLRGHRLNLWYNGLISNAYILRVGGYLSQAELHEALTWLENMADDEVHGDESVQTLDGDFGSSELLKLLHSLGDLGRIGGG